MNEPEQTAISLAQWSLVSEFHSGKIKTLDFPGIAKIDFGLKGIELVNTLMEVPTNSYLDKLKEKAAEHGVTIVLIMIDDEGDGCANTQKDRIQFAINHRKWVDIARYLGCHAIRTNCRGQLQDDPEEALEWASESYQSLLEYAVPAGIHILIENHGGFSNDPDWMTSLFKKVDHPFLGSLPDWREPGPSFDHISYLKKMLPFAGGMSVRIQPDETQTATMINLCREGGYKGWYGVESDGRHAIQETIRLLRKYLDPT